MTQALYRTLANNILSQITSGEIKVGQRFPPEAAYASELGVSRSTLRQAFSLLENSAILKRRKRGGTEVIADKPVKRFNMAVGGGYYGAIDDKVIETTLTITAINDVPRSSVSAIGCSDNLPDEWVLYSGIRCKDEEKIPFASLALHVPKHLSEFGAGVGEYTSSIFEKIEQTYGITISKVLRKYSAGACRSDVGKIIELNEGDPVLLVTTQFCDDEDQAVVVVEESINPGRYNCFCDVSVEGGV